MHVLARTLQLQKSIASAACPIFKTYTQRGISSHFILPLRFYPLSRWDHPAVLQRAVCAQGPGM